MKSELTPGWNIFKQIFHDHWDEFKQFNPRYDHAYYDELVNKMLACGNPEQIGYLDYRCLDCGGCDRSMPNNVGLKSSVPRVLVSPENCIKAYKAIRSKTF